MSAGDSSRAHVVEIDELVSSMRRKLHFYFSRGETHSMENTLCMIYKVPQHIREAERPAYEPIVLSIGPYHHGNPALQAFEKEKWNCLDYILKLNPERDLHDYLKVIVRLESQVRNCYTEDIKIDRKNFLQMLLLDGCYILVTLHGTAEIVPPRQEVYGRNVNNNKITEKDGIEQKGVSLGRNINEEAISENSTPKNAYTNKENLVLEVEPGQATASLKSTQDYKPECEKQDQYQESCDLIGLWYDSFVAHDLLLLENQIPFFIVKSLYELVSGKDAAFAPVTNKLANYVECIVRYYPTTIQESERPKDFHHLLHLCHMYFRPSQKLKEGHQNQFVSMPEDAILLAQRGIIEHQLRSDKEVSVLFTKLSKDVVFDFGGNFYLKSIFRATEAHYQSRLNMWMAWLRHNHFSNPWLALGALAAAIMLFCTIVQTLIAVYSYMKP